MNRTNLYRTMAIAFMFAIAACGGGSGDSGDSGSELVGTWKQVDAHPTNEPTFIEIHGDGTWTLSVPGVCSPYTSSYSIDGDAWTTTDVTYQGTNPICVLPEPGYTTVCKFELSGDDLYFTKCNSTSPGSEPNTSAQYRR